MLNNYSKKDCINELMDSRVLVPYVSTDSLEVLKVKTIASQILCKLRCINSNCYCGTVHQAIEINSRYVSITIASLNNVVNTHYDDVIIYKLFNKTYVGIVKQVVRELYTDTIIVEVLQGYSEYGISCSIDDYRAIVAYDGKPISYTKFRNDTTFIERNKVQSISVSDKPLRYAEFTCNMNEFILSPCKTYLYCTSTVTQHYLSKVTNIEVM